MPLYNVRAGYGEGGRMSRVYSFTAPNEVVAEAFVMDRLTEQSVELWCFSRKVACFEGKQACELAVKPGWRAWSAGFSA